jgi:hypothetical protein
MAGRLMTRVFNLAKKMGFTPEDERATGTSPKGSSSPSVEEQRYSSNDESQVEGEGCYEFRKTGNHYRGAGSWLLF